MTELIKLTKNNFLYIILCWRICKEKFFTATVTWPVQI